MSTPSFIGVLCKEGIIKFVYCHSDSYPSYLGKMLLEHYNTPELATALVDLGSLSTVRERLAPDEGETHTFDTPVRHGPKGGVTTAYHRDRGDDLEIDSVVVDTPVVLKNAETLLLNILEEENITYGYVLHSNVLYWRSRSCRSWQLSVPGRRAGTDRFLVHAQVFCFGRESSRKYIPTKKGVMTNAYGNRNPPAPRWRETD